VLWLHHCHDLINIHSNVMGTRGLCKSILPPESVHRCVITKNNSSSSVIVRGTSAKGAAAQMEHICDGMSRACFASHKSQLTQTFRVSENASVHNVDVASCPYVDTSCRSLRLHDK
jgi:hypothetical protein